MWYFTSDQHFGHEKVIKYCNRPYSSIEEMDEILIENHNKVVKNNDIVVHGGDFSFLNKEVKNKYVKKLNGNHIFVRGNHDYWLPKSTTQIYCKNVLGQYIVVSHFPMLVWPSSSYNSWGLYGHCLDLNTEILTDSGWKFRKDLSLYDKILTLNINTNFFEYNNINEIIDYPYYNGNMYSYKSRGIDLRVTEQHVLIDRNRTNKKINKFIAKDLIKKCKRIFIKSGILNKNEYLIKDDYIRLLVWISADGNLCNSNLCRIKLFKERKKKIIEELLNKLNIAYRKLHQKDGCVSFNFSIPNELKDFNFKPIDKKICLFNKYQIELLLKEYVVTDGHLYGKTYVIYTSKKEEADLIQIACITNGYTCNITTRNPHSDMFSNKNQYELYITDRTESYHENLKNKTKIELTNEYVWCVKTNNKTIVIRRNGKPLVVGNCHGKLDTEYKQHDISVDNNNYYPISFDELKEIIDKKKNNIDYEKR